MMRRLKFQPFCSFLVKGFTLVELLIAISILGIVTMVAAPSLSEFVVESRADGEIITLQRLVLTARNTAINTGQNVTLCPLSSNECTSNWQNELSVFTNTGDNEKYDSASEQLVKTRDKVASGDKVKFSDGKALIFSPTGRLISGQNTTFIYCPGGHPDLARGIDISMSGRTYITQDTDNDDKDEDRSGNELSCS
jgi:prepilin-type N-terminal cleavage/methylation domain-containing protein